MDKVAWIAVTLFFAVSHAQCAPLEKDERDVLRSAHVYHIMGASQGALEKLRTQLDSVPANQLLSEFKRLARARSADPASVPSGGDLGFIVEGTMDEKFETTVFSLPPMQVSSPRQSAFGWHLILVTSTKEEPIQDICERSLREAQGAVPINPAALFRFSLERQSLTSLHPEVLQYIGGGWSSPSIWDGKLAYMRAEPDSRPGMARLVIHSEIPFAHYNAFPRACRRSARDVFQVDCAASAVALVLHVEYEGRAAAGRRLTSVEHDSGKLMFQPMPAGVFAQFAEQACADSKR